MTSQIHLTTTPRILVELEKTHNHHHWICNMLLVGDGNDATGADTANDDPIMEIL